MINFDSTFCWQNLREIKCKIHCKCFVRERTSILWTYTKCKLTLVAGKSTAGNSHHYWALLQRPLLWQLVAVRKGDIMQRVNLLSLQRSPVHPAGHSQLSCALLQAPPLWQLVAQSYWQPGPKCPTTQTIMGGKYVMLVPWVYWIEESICVMSVHLPQPQLQMQ